MISQMKYNAFCKEFPFLHHVALDGVCDSIKVKRMTPDFLNSTPRIDGGTGSLVSIEDGEYITIVTPSGVQVNAVKQSESWIHNEAYTDNESWQGESILDALYRLQAEDCTFIVKVSGGYNINDHCSRDNWQATIYKPAKDITIGELIAQAVARAEAQVKAEAAF